MCGSLVDEVVLSSQQSLMQKVITDVSLGETSSELDCAETRSVSTEASSDGNLFESETNATDVKDKDNFRRQYMRKLCSQKVWVPQEERLPKHETVIVFDWDDTLLYTTFLKKASGRNISTSIKQHLDSVEKASYELLNSALHCGKTFIITNAEDGWVEESAALFMPSLLPILDKVVIISARSTQKMHCEDSSQWKTQAFLEMGRLLQGDRVVNLVSIGDSDHELHAAKVFGKLFEHSVIKTVKFKERPSPVELAKELHLILPKFTGIVKTATSINMSAVRKMSAN